MEPNRRISDAEGKQSCFVAALLLALLIGPFVFMLIWWIGYELRDWWPW